MHDRTLVWTVCVTWGGGGAADSLMAAGSSNIKSLGGTFGRWPYDEVYPEDTAMSPSVWAL